MDGMIGGVGEMEGGERESKGGERAKGTGSSESLKQSKAGYIPTNYSFQLIISSPPSLSLS